MADLDTYDPLDPLGPFPRVAWSDDDPARLIEERLALVALASRAASVPPAALVARSAMLGDPLAAGRDAMVVHELRRALAEAAQVIAKAPWGRADGLVTLARDDGGLRRVVPDRGRGDDECIRVARQLCLASAVELTDAPIDVVWLPLQLVAANPPLAALGVDPAAFMFMGTNETPAGDRLWLYKHVATRGYLNFDAEGRPWRYEARTSSYAPYDDLAAALAGARVVPEVAGGAEIGR